MRVQARFPRAFDRTERSLSFVVDQVLSHSLFALILTLVLVVMGFAGVNALVLVSSWGSFLIAFLWIARASKTIKQLSIGARGLTLLTVGLVLGLGGYTLAKWGKDRYSELQANQANELAEAIAKRLPAPKKTSDPSRPLPDPPTANLKPTALPAKNAPPLSGPSENVGAKDEVTAKVVRGPAATVPTHTNFFLHEARTTLQQAESEAAESGKLLFIVVYDDQHPTLSKLEYSLGYFMEYQTTKRLVDTYFVPAVVSVSSKGAKALVTEDDPLENCLWVVLNTSGQVLRREGVYANPDEGLKRVRDVIANYGKK